MPVPDPNTGEPLLNPQTGRPMTVLMNMMDTVYDDVTIETDDMFDTWFDPAANRFQDLAWKLKRFKIRDAELEALLEDENWDADGIREVLSRDSGEPRATGPDSTEHPKLLTENLTLEDVKDLKSYGYYGGWYFEGTLPDDVAQDVGLNPAGTAIIRIIGGTLVQAVHSPQRFGKIQGGSITILPTGRGLYGLSPLTVVRYLQDIGDTQLILTVQALIESVYQNYLLGGDMGPNFARNLETRRPREVFTVQGEIDQVAPLPKDYTGLQIASGALNLISQTMRNAMNARDPIQGNIRQSGDRVTATESQNTDQLAVLIERDELPVLGHLINDLYYINLDDEGKVFRRVGETEPTQVNYFDIDAVTDITFVGARSLMSKAGMANQFRDFARECAGLQPVHSRRR
jgi:hypothetical protein